MDILVRHLKDDDRRWANAVLRENWGDLKIVTLGRSVDSSRLPGLVAEVGRRRVGLLIFEIRGRVCEIVSLNSMAEEKGVGTSLIQAAVSLGITAGCTRLVLSTTNDNTHAMRFYQKRGFHIAAVNLDVMNQYRELKPNIPHLGQDEIPIRDEIVFEMAL